MPEKRKMLGMKDRFKKYLRELGPRTLAQRVLVTRKVYGSAVLQFCRFSELLSVLGIALVGPFLSLSLGSI